VFRAILRKISPVVPRLRAPEKQEPEASAPVGKKPYSRPEVRKLGTEQGILLLVGRAWAGDKGARELLELVFPEPGGMPAAASTALEQVGQSSKGQ
jgi:hypothetical protein